MEDKTPTNLRRTRSPALTSRNVVKKIRIAPFPILSKAIIKIIDNKFIESKAQQYGDVETNMPDELPSSMILLFLYIYLYRIFWIGGWAGRVGGGWLISIKRNECGW